MSASFFSSNEKTPSFFSLSLLLVLLLLVFVVIKRKSSKVCVVVRRSHSRLRSRLRQNGRLWVHHLSKTTTEKDGAVSGTVRERREFRRRRRPIGSDVLVPNLVTTFNNRPKKGRGGQKSFGRRRTRWDSNSRSSAGSRGLFFQC